MCIGVSVSLCCIPETHNIVAQLYFNEKNERVAGKLPARARRGPAWSSRLLRRSTHHPSL